MKHRLLVIANIGFIIGIIMGLYFKESIILFLSIFVGIIILFLNSSILSDKIQRYRKNETVNKLYNLNRYLKKFITKSVYITFIFFVLGGFLILRYNENKFEKFIYANSLNETHKVFAFITSNKKAKDYVDTYKIKILQIDKTQVPKNIFCFVNLKKQNNEELKYGDLICFEGEFQTAADRTNYKGFSYKEYLKTINVCGTYQTTYSKVKVLSKDKLNKVYLLTNKVRQSIERKN